MRAVGTREQPAVPVGGGERAARARGRRASRDQPAGRDGGRARSSWRRWWPATARVSAVTLLDGDSRQARPLLDALRRERFEPGRFRGRPVAVSVYRLISRMEVRAPSPRRRAAAVDRGRDVSTARPSIARRRAHDRDARADGRPARGIGRPEQRERRRAPGGREVGDARVVADVERRPGPAARRATRAGRLARRDRAGHARSSRAAARRPPGPSTSRNGSPRSASQPARRSASAGQFLAGEPLPGCTARNRSGRRSSQAAAAARLARRAGAREAAVRGRGQRRATSSGAREPVRGVPAAGGGSGIAGEDRAGRAAAEVARADRALRV